MSMNMSFAYDKESGRYIILKSVSSSDTDRDSMFLRDADIEVDKAIRNLADAIEKKHSFKMEQIKFLLKHRNDEKENIKFSQSNEEYLTFLDNNINESTHQDILRRREFVDTLERSRNISVGSTSMFLFSFLSDISDLNLQNLVFENIDDWILNRYDFDKENCIVEYLNALTYNKGNVKIFLTEKDNRETVKIVDNYDIWENIVHNFEYQKMLIDVNTQTSVYSISLEKFVEIEKGLKASTSAKDFLDEKLGGPSAIKQKGEKTIK